MGLKLSGRKKGAKPRQAVPRSADAGDQQQDAPEAGGPAAAAFPSPPSSAPPSSVLPASGTEEAASSTGAGASERRQAPKRARGQARQAARRSTSDAPHSPHAGPEADQLRPTTPAVRNEPQERPGPSGRSIANNSNDQSSRGCADRSGRGPAGTNDNTRTPDHAPNGSLASKIDELGRKIQELKSFHRTRMLAKDYKIREAGKRYAAAEAEESRLESLLAAVTAVSETLATERDEILSELQEAEAANASLTEEIESLREGLREQRDYFLSLLENASRIPSIPDPSPSTRLYTQSTRQLPLTAQQSPAPGGSAGRPDTAPSVSQSASPATDQPPTPGSTTQQAGGSSAAVTRDTSHTPRASDTNHDGKQPHDCANARPRAGRRKVGVLTCELKSA